MLREVDISMIGGDFAHISKQRSKRKNQGSNLVHASTNEEGAKKLVL